MSFAIIKKNLEVLCTQLQEVAHGEIEWDKEGVREKLRAIRRGVIDSDQWIEKTAHIQLRICDYMWTILESADQNWETNLEYTRSRANEIDGLMEEAIRIDNEERMHCIPKPLRPPKSANPLIEWLSTLDDSYGDDFITTKDIYDYYSTWMDGNYPYEEKLEPNALGMKLGKEEFVKKFKKIDGKSERVWMIRII